MCVQRILTSGEDGQKGKLPWDIFRCSISLLGLESLTQHIHQTTFMRAGVGELNDGNISKFFFIWWNFNARCLVKLVDFWVSYWTIGIKNESQESHFPVIEGSKTQNFSWSASHDDTIGRPWLEWIPFFSIRYCPLISG